jgi:hypothetical protein
LIESVSEIKTPPVPHPVAPEIVAPDLNVAEPPSPAAIALSEGEDLMDVDVVSYDPGDDLYGVAGEDEAVRVKAS